MIIIAATNTQAPAQRTPSRESGRTLRTPKTSAAEAMISPPADRPTKNAT